jgi:hypothetical protein
MMIMIQEPIYQVTTEPEFRAYCDKHPDAGVANAQVGYRSLPDGVCEIHRASCPHMNRKNHVENQAGTKYAKYVSLSLEVLQARWPQAGLCVTCCRASQAIRKLLPLKTGRTA